MKILSFLSNWYNNHRQRYLDKMKEQGKCPICKGFGFETVSSSYMGHSYECQSCNGTGLYSEWEESEI